MTLIPSKVDSLVIYPQQVRSRRVAPVEDALLSSGEVIELLIALPNGFDKDSIQVEFNEGMAQCASLGGVTVIPLPDDDEHIEELEEAEQRRKGLQERKEKIEREQEVLQQRVKQMNLKLSFVESMIQRSVEQPSIISTSSEMWQVSTWESQLEVLESARRERGNEVFNLECQAKALEEELNIVLREMAGGVEWSNRKLRRECVRVVLSIVGEVPSGSEKTLFISYLMPNASWSATYEAHYDSKKNTLHIFYNALVTLNGGEDVSHVHVTLCSTTPRHLSAEPELDPWRCGLQSADVSIPVSHHNPLNGIQQRQAEEEKGSAVNFVLPTLVSLKSDGEARRFPLVQLTFACDVDYASVPALDSAVYTRVGSVNDSDYLLLPGKAALFLDGSYLCSSQIQRSAPGAKLNIDFGVEPAVELKRVLLSELNAAQKKRLTWDSEQVVHSFVYRSTITNHKSCPVQVEVREKAPKSNEGSLKVRLVEPEELSTDEEKALYDTTGQVKLNVIVPPKASKEVLFGFAVESPKGKTVIGLHDRH